MSDAQGWPIEGVPLSMMHPPLLRAVMRPAERAAGCFRARALWPKAVKALQRFGLRPGKSLLRAPP